MTLTAYVVLVEQKPGEWAHVLNRATEAYSADAAIRDAAVEVEEGPGSVMVAVPARFWRPRLVRVETATRVTLT